MTKFQKPVSLFLVFALVFMLMACPLLQPKADAIVPAAAWVASDAVFYIVTFALGLVGISFASKSDMAQAVNEFLNDNPTIKTYLAAVTDTSIILAGDGSHKLHLTAELYSWIATTLVPSVSNYFSRDKTEVSVTDYGTQLVKGIPITSGIATMTAAQLFQVAPYPGTQSVTIIKNNVSYVYTLGAWAGSAPDSFRYIWVKIGTAAATQVQYKNQVAFVNAQYNGSSSVALSNRDERFGFCLSSDGTTLNPYIVVRSVDTLGNVFYNVKYSLASGTTCYGGFPLTGESISFADKALEYLRDMGYSLTELISSLQTLIGKMPGALDIPIDEPVEDVVEGKKEAEDGTVSIPLTIWTNIWALLGLKELMKSLTFTDDPTNSDNKYKPSITEIPGIAGTWGYVTSFLGSALIWMQLWFDGFSALPVALKSTLWAVLVITIFTGLLGVFLR